MATEKAKTQQCCKDADGPMRALWTARTGSQEERHQKREKLVTLLNGDAVAFILVGPHVHSTKC